MQQKCDLHNSDFNMGQLPMPPNFNMGQLPMPPIYIIVRENQDKKIKKIWEEIDSRYFF